jgi:uncharacterized protein (DUF433 family)
MQQSKLYVHTDEHGVMRVGATRVMLESVVAGFQQGHLPETIQQQYPALSLEEVYGSIAWYLEHIEEAEQYLARQAAMWEHEREKAARRLSPVVQRLRALREQKTTTTS